MKNLLLLFCLLTTWALHTASAQGRSGKMRTIVTTDGEVDDQDSFIRMLLYTNEFELVGMVYSSSQWHYKGDGKGTLFSSEMPNTAERYGERSELRWPGSTWMEEMVDKYAQVYPTLKQHAEGFPTPDYLKSIIRVGNIDFEGEMEKETEGSNFIKDILLDNVPGPVYLQIWGGTNTVARALKSIEEQYKGTPQWNSIYKKVSEKAILYTVLDQDATYKKYVEPNWPNIKVMYNADQFWSFAYLWPRVVPAELKTYLQGEWFKENIKFNHGPLAEAYFLWGDGQVIAGDPEHTHGNPDEAKKYKLGQYDFISEGDSPAYLHLVSVGLRNMEDAAYGGWGGRMVQSASSPNRWEDGDNVTDYNPYTQKDDKAYPQTRWIKEIQNDFAARADWCVSAVADANHAPKVTITGSLDLKASPGKKVTLAGKVVDPDGDAVSYKWWQYWEVDSYAGKVSADNEYSSRTSLTVPADAAPGQTIHMILEVTDAGTPALTRYQRVIISVI